ncbi:hypothetical protein EJ02DRAFT_429088 [Clathrospora elynae]|uniref:Mediator complex subunit 15 KIX domain-containing protein n=1 Tax=Clathrospora elynae TaxID=706981 RepID=A0A6A5S1X5_9PLEO|nr:hypothetical protein EJ02DRAFT_429088 [Clathrospora elynae]
MDNCKEEILVKFEADVQSWPEERKQHLISQGISPIFLRFRQHAEMMYQRGALGPNQPGLNQNAGAMPQPGQPNRMQNQQMNMNQHQPNQDFDFNEITNRQMEAMRSQDQGTTVVPASNNANGAQMVGFPGQTPQQNQPQNAAMQQQRQAAEAFHRQQQVQQAHAQAQAQAQSRLEHQRQQQAAQARNQQQNQLLQGQIGGLNLPDSRTSPAMPMLTRPMPPPGQSGPPGTPQPQPPQAHVPIMTPQPGQSESNLTDLMRQAQQRAAAVSQANQPPLTDQVRLNMMPADMDPVIKQQLLKVPEHQFRSILHEYTQQLRRGTMQNAPFPPGHPNHGQPNMMFNPQQQLQPGVPGTMLSGPNMANMARGGMNFSQQQPGAGQQPQTGGQRIPMQTQQQRIAAAQSLLRQNPGIIHSTDPKGFPPNILGTQIRQSLPSEVKTWQQLKLWAAQNPALMPGVDANKLVMLQVLHFQDLVRQSGGMPGVHPPQQPNGSGLAPPVQVTPNQGPIRTPQQQQQMMQSMTALQVTPQEIQIFRQRLDEGPAT